MYCFKGKTEFQLKDFACFKIINFQYIVESNMNKVRFIHTADLHLDTHSSHYQI